MNECGRISIHKTIDWYLENEQWWRKIIDGSYRDWLVKNYSEKDL